MKKNKIISAVICILMVLTLLCGCQDSKKYPTECKESPSQTEEQVLWPSYEQTDVLSDGNLALVDFTHKDEAIAAIKKLANDFKYQLKGDKKEKAARKSKES